MSRRTTRPYWLSIHTCCEWCVSSDIRIERIVSTGQASPPGFWYDQEQDEWVVLLTGKAKIVWEDGQSRALSAGEWLLIPAHQRHRVEWTAKEPPPCIWLAVHGKLSPVVRGIRAQVFNP